MPDPEDIMKKAEWIEGSPDLRIVSAGEHAQAKDFLGRVSLAAQTEGRPLRAVFNGYELHVDGSIDAEDLDQAYQASVIANKRIDQPPAKPLDQPLKRAA